MAGNLLSSYDEKNFELLDDYKVKFNSLDVGEPDVNVVLSGESAQISTVVWKRGVLQESARWQYVGMNYQAAQACAQQMRSLLTYTKYPWLYGDYIDNSNWLYGWHKGVGTPTLDSEINVCKHGVGCMYDVVVDAKVELESYTTLGYESLVESAPLKNVLTSVPGWGSEPHLDGKNFASASHRNIHLVSAPTRKVTFELVGENVNTTTISSDLSTTIQTGNWYRATIDQYCHVRYEGLRKSACTELISSLNSYNGWYKASYPWTLSAWAIPGSGGLNINWVQDTSISSWQCLNDYSATEGDGGMFNVELMLHAQDHQMTQTPGQITSFTWPSVWDKVPGLSAYL